MQRVITYLSIFFLSRFPRGRSFSIITRFSRAQTTHARPFETLNDFDREGDRAKFERMKTLTVSKLENSCDYNDWCPWVKYTSCNYTESKVDVPITLIVLKIEIWILFSRSFSLLIIIYTISVSFLKNLICTIVDAVDEFFLHVRIFISHKIIIFKINHNAIIQFWLMSRLREHIWSNRVLVSFG